MHVMNCQQYKALWTERRCGGLDEEQVRIMHHHQDSCMDCKQYDRQMNALLARLQQYPEPAPLPVDTTHRLMLSAVTGRKIQRRARYAVAATLVLGFIGGTLFWSVVNDFSGVNEMIAGNPSLLNDPLPAVTLSLHRVEVVHLAINVKHAIAQATMTIDLPPGVEIDGFPGQSQLRWETDLKAGRNTLTLPLTAHSVVADGVLKARVDYGGGQKELAIILNVPDTHADRPAEVDGGFAPVLVAAFTCHPQQNVMDASLQRRFFI
jgi:hypothetical protein